MKTFFKNSLDWAHSEFPALFKFIAQAIFFAGTVLVTIWLAPSINRDFAKEDRRTAFYISTMEALNNDTKDLLADITIYIDPTYTSEDRPALRAKIRRTATKLYWRRIEFALVFNDKKFEIVLQNFGDSLKDLMEAVDQSGDKAGQEKVRAPLEKFGLSVARVVEYLAAKVDV